MTPSNPQPLPFITGLLAEKTRLEAYSLLLAMICGFTLFIWHLGHHFLGFTEVPEVVKKAAFCTFWLFVALNLIRYAAIVFMTSLIVLVTEHVMLFVSTYVNALTKPDPQTPPPPPGEGKNNVYSLFDGPQAS